MRLRSIPGLLGVLVCGVATALGAPPPAAAAIPPVSGPAVLGFGATYRGPDGASRTHSGLDLAGATGSTVVSPVEGTITFAGPVPGTDAAGTRVGCVTVADGQGRRWSLLPLDGLTVSKGQSVRAGARVGALAAAGDASVAGPHLHLGLRVGELYRDPAPELETPPEVFAPAQPAPEEPADDGRGADPPRSDDVQAAEPAVASPQTRLEEGASRSAGERVADAPAPAGSAAQGVSAPSASIPRAPGRAVGLAPAAPPGEASPRTGPGMRAGPVGAGVDVGARLSAGEADSDLALGVSGSLETGSDAGDGSSAATDRWLLENRSPVVTWARDMLVRAVVWLLPTERRALFAATLFAALAMLAGIGAVAGSGWTTWRRSAPACVRARP